MQRLLLSALAFFVLLSPLAATPKITAEDSQNSSSAQTHFIALVFREPSSLFKISPDSKSKEQRYIAENPKIAVPIPGSGTQFDVSGYSRASGLPTPPGSAAIYDAASMQLVIVTSSENKIPTQQIYAVSMQDSFLCSIKLSIIEYIPESEDESLPESIAVSEFLKHVKKQVRTLAEITGVSSNGTPLNFSQMIGNESTDVGDASKPFGEGESGLKANVQSIVTSMTGKITFQMQCRFRSDPALTNGKSVNLFLSTSDLALWAAHPVVIHTGTLPADSHGDKEPHKFAIIVNVGFVNAGGWKTDASGKFVP